MAHIQQLNDYRSPVISSGIYEKLLRSLGTEEFGETARESVMSVTNGIRRIYLFEAKGREGSELRYFSGEPEIADMLHIYVDKYLASDPLHDAFRAAPAPNTMSLLRLRPEDVCASGYRRRFFDDAGIIERLSIVQRGQDAWRVMNLSRHESDGPISETETSSLIGLATLVLPMLPFSGATSEKPRHLSVEQLEERFARRYPELTLRERQVCARAVTGMTVEGTAIDLNVARTSVQTYRKRAYQRLCITSQYELSSLVSH